MKDRGRNESKQERDEAINKVRMQDRKDRRKKSMKEREQ